MGNNHARVTMSSVFIAPIAVKSADYMKVGRISPFTINWRVIIGISLALGILLLYFLLSPTGNIMEFPAEGYLELEGEANRVYYRRATPENGGRFTVLLLHGQAFSSQTWDDLGTLKFLRAKNYDVVALDLPGYVKSKDYANIPKTSEERARFLNEVIEKLHIERPVIVSPSMSGSYSLPFIFQGEKGRNLRGYIPVAPVGTEKYTKDDYENLELPTLIVYGENDETLGLSSLQRLNNIRGHIIHVIKDAGHACYLKNSDEFHDNVEKFLSKLN